jgi:uncharacterized integral membrane protein (TIGR00698 family)
MATTNTSLSVRVLELLPKRRDITGLAVAAAVVVVAFAVHRRSTAVSPLVISVAIGVLLTNLGLIGPRMRSGLTFAAKRLLRIGVVLLGTQLAARNVIDLGGPGLIVVLVVVTGTFFGTQWLGRRLGLSAPLSLLVATGFSICGASAVAAMEPLSGAEEEDVTYAIAMVTLCGSLAIAILPLVNRLWLRLDDATFGSWVGASVHDVAQTVAAASAVSDKAREAAVIVKLTRVVLLAPLVAGVSMWRRRSGKADSTGTADSTVNADSRPPILPLFVVGFLAAIALRSTGWLPKPTIKTLKSVEQILLAIALVGLGTGVQWAKLRKVGGRPLILALASWTFIAVVSLVGVKLTH